MEPRISQFGPSIQWLLAKDVSSSRLASLFRTSAENIRVAAFRSRYSAIAEIPDEPFLSKDQSPIFPPTIRGGRDEVVRTPARNRALETLTNEIDQVVQERTASYDYLSGIRELRRLLPRIGFAGDSRRIALAARLRQHIAWFMVHSGYCESAGIEARTARDLWKAAYHESSERRYLNRFIESALIGAHAYLLLRRPEGAWKLLDIADDATRFIGKPIGSDHFRQRGVALLQLQKDENAVTYFRKSQQAMETLAEARVPAQLLMTGLRYISFLESNVEESHRAFDATRDAFGSQSLEFAMAAHWMAACGLTTDSHRVIQSSLDLLATAPEPSQQFGHQLTIRRLLSLTPSLGLDARLQKLWVRRVLYENAFRNS